MKIYIAALWSRREEMREVEKRLVAEGHMNTARWLWTTAPNEPKFWQPEALVDVDDIVESDAVLTFTQPYKSMNSGGGRHFEFGLAYGLRKLLIGVGEQEIIFHHLPRMHFFDTLDEAMKFLKGYIP